MRSSALLVAAIVCASIAVAMATRGATPEFESKLSSSDSITCDGGSVTIKKDWVNDDFCDCQDGSDEPGTSACKNGKFYCVNSGHLPLTIPSQWVDDGHCDCCDGSDEAASACPNTCEAAAAEHLKKKQELLQTMQVGISIREGYVENAKSAKAEKAARKQVIEAEITTLDSKIDTLQKEKENAEAAHKTLRDSVDARLSEEHRVARAAEGLEPESEPELEPEAASEAEQEAEPTPEIVHPSPDDDPEVQKLSEAAGHTRSRSQYIFDIEDDSEQEDNDSFFGNALSFFQRFFAKTPEELRRLEKQKIEVELRELRKQRDELNSELTALNKFFSLDLGPDDAFFGLYDQTFEYHAKEYVYEVKPFQAVYQKPKSGHGSTRIGDWDAWGESGHKEMSFTHGERCWGGPDRSMKVTLECGEKNEILSVVEPSKCEYVATMKTPALCVAS